LGLMLDLFKMINYLRSGSQDEDKRRRNQAASYRNRQRMMVFEDQERKRQAHSVNLGSLQPVKVKPFRYVIPDLIGSLELLRIRRRE